MSGLTSDARAVPHGGGGRQGGTKTRAAGIPVKTLSVLPSSCPNIFFLFFMGNKQGESKASEGRQAEMVGTQSSYVSRGGKRPRLLNSRQF